jgi:hypothetical protein
MTTPTSSARHFAQLSCHAMRGAPPVNGQKHSTMHGPYINVLERDGHARDVGEVWALRKGAHVAVCGYGRIPSAARCPSPSTVTFSVAKRTGAGRHLWIWRSTGNCSFRRRAGAHEPER